eukprot:COSAG01_NODE_67400_length_267_cov_0.619048_1_plen_40_part_10
MPGHGELVARLPAFFRRRVECMDRILLRSQYLTDCRLSAQ